MALDLSKYGLTPTAAPKPSGGSLDLSKYGVTPTQSQTAAPIHEPSVASSVWSMIANQFSSGTETAKQGYNEASVYAPTTGSPLTEAGHLVEGIGKVVGGAAIAATSLGAPVFNALNAVGKPLQDSLLNDPGTQAFANSPAGQMTKRVVDTGLNYANAFGTVAGAEALPGQIRAGVDTIKSAIPESVPTKAPTPNKSAQVVSALTDEWAKPTETPGAQYDKARSVTEASPTTPKFLAEQGIDPRAHTVDGKFFTTDTADSLRAIPGKLSRDTLRPSLQMADYTTPKTLVPDLNISDKLIQSQGRGITVDDMEAVRAKVQAKLDALQRKYPEGMSLTDMHDEGITFNQNGKFSPVGDPATDNIAIANRALGTTLKQAVETKAPASVPVHEFNQYLSQYYRAADYLDALNNKKVPVSFMQGLTRGAFKFGGAAMAEHLAPGVVSAFAGYQIGKAIEHAIENLPNPLRERFISNLEITQPEAAKALQQYLQEQGTAAGTRIGLPAPSFTPMGPRTPNESSVMSVPAEPGPPGFDPVTGKFKKTYKSTPK